MHRIALVCLGFLLVLIQGQAALQAAELPQVLTGVNARFDGAQLPVVTGSHMVVNQFADKATLHWQSFNVSADGKVEFKQPSTTSVALNRVFDAAPSQVNGQISANGQVYLINQNGIVFGPGARVNTQSLVASTLDIDDAVYEDIGIVNAINEPSGPRAAFDSFGRPMGEIRIAEGASLESAKGGRILVFAPSIVNEGTLSTPEGQQVLAAAEDRVLIAASDDANLRGLLVEVSTGGDVTNLGSLIAERGSISLLGMAVNQEGVARATTSVSLNGSVRLLAQDMNGTLAVTSDLVPRKPRAVRGGDLTVGSASLTEVVPDSAPAADGSTVLAVDAQSQPQSRIDLAASRIRVRSGARLTATGGVIDATAAANPAQPVLAQPGNPDLSAVEMVVEEGAILDASGDDSTVVPVSRNVVEVEARGNELADSPLQRDGPIRNETLLVDVRRGTDFLNIEGAVASVGRSAAERQSAGGSIRVRSEGRFVLAEGARMDVSGGQVAYTEGLVTTSRLRQANGKVVDISNADPDQSYTGVVGAVASREAGYVEGKDAGTLQVQARGIELAGGLAASVTVGANQRQRPGSLQTGVPSFARPFDQVPLRGGLSLSLLRSGLPQLVVGVAPPPSPGTAPPLVISVGQLRDSGAGRISLSNAGPVLLNADLELPAWSDLALTGPDISLIGNLRIAGGTVTLNASNELVGVAAVPDAAVAVRVAGVVDLSGTWVNDNPLVNRQRPVAPIVLDGGALQVNSGFDIEVSDTSRLDVSAGAYLAGDGSFTGGRGGHLGFATGSSDINPGLGARLILDGELRAFGFEAGGALDIDVERVEVTPQPGSGGIEDPFLDGKRQFALREISNGPGISQYVLEVGSATFQQGGFGTYDLSASRSDLQVAAGAEVVLRTASYLLAGAAPSLAATGTPMSRLVTPAFNPDFARRPVALVLRASEDLASTIGPVANLAIRSGASIVADAGSSISLQSDTSLFIDGRIDAPAGQIDVTVSGGPGIFLPDQMIWLGPTAVLSARGTALVDTLNPLGLRFGEVLDAGSVSVRAEHGSIIGAPGASIDVDGAAATLDIGLGFPVRTRVASAAGAIDLTAAESLLFQGRLSGAAPAGSMVSAGRLTIGIDPGLRGVPPLFGVDGIPRGPHTLVVGDFTGTLPGAGAAVDPQYYTTGFVPLTALRNGGFSSLDLVVRSSATGTNNVGAPVPDTPESLPVIEFPADIDLSLARSIRLDAAVFETVSAQVSLAAPYVSIGYTDTRVPLDGAIPDKTSVDNPQETNTPIRLTPGVGAGRFAVYGELVELAGESVTRGFGDAAAGTDGMVIAATGDLRLRGVRTTLTSDYDGLFRTAGNLSISAARIYPTTLTSYELTVEGAVGRLTLAGGGVAPAPLSVGGAVTLNAATIVQGGALFAPLGALDFRAGSLLQFAPGSLTSTSAGGIRAPFFRTEPGGALVIPAPAAGEDQVVFVETVNNPEYERILPEKRISLAAPDIELAPGSRFDVRGGSDVAATEFVPGPGGSADILLADLDTSAGVEANGSFAILPGLGSFAPYDPLETPAAASVQGIRVGDTVVLEEGIGGLPAGEYAILPARYALFGGFLVTPEQRYQDLVPGQSLRRLDGAPILAGRFGVAGSDAADSRSQGFAIETGDQVRQRAEYLQTALDDLYTEGVVRAPRDAGRLVVTAGDGLDLRGELVRGASAGLDAAVDIATTAALSVVAELTGAGGIELRASDLANFGAGSLLLGGTRSAIAGGLVLEATSSLVTVASGVTLDQPELLLVGDRIVVDASVGASTRLQSTAEASDLQTVIRVNDEAAVLALSDRQLVFERGAAGTAGDTSIVVAEGAALEAGGSLVVDAAGDVDADGSLAVRDGRLSLGAVGLSLGETDGATIDSGLVLSNADLAAIAGNDLQLRSGGLVDVYGELRDEVTGLPLVFGALDIDASGLRGLHNDGRTAVLAADVVRLRNSSGAAPAGPPAGAAPGSALDLRASDRLELGAGPVAVQGFAGSRLGAGSAVMFTGNGSLAVEGDLAVDSPWITGTGFFDSTVLATGRLTVTSGGVGAGPPAAGLGGSLAFTAADIGFDGRVVLPSGTVRLTQSGDLAGARGLDGGVQVGESAVIDVAGKTLGFGPRKVGTPGGRIVLAAETGDLGLDAGARLDVSAASSGDVEAGEVSWLAPLGRVTFDPDLQLQGQGPGQSAGRFLLDAGLLVSADAGIGNALTGLNRALGAGGFRGGRDVRLRQQDIVVEAGSVITAHDIRLVADSGSVGIAGALDATGEQGGRVWIAAGDRLALSGTVNAAAVGDSARGGRVDLFALDADGDDADGTAGDVVDLLPGASIDVSGGSGGRGGEVFVHGRRLDTDGDGQTETALFGAASGQVVGAERAQWVATRVLRDPNAVLATDPGTGAQVTQVRITAGQIEAWRSETGSFLDALSSPMTGPLQVTAGLQIESTGDLQLLAPWDFMEGWYFGQDLSDPTAPRLGLTGLTTLRAARHIELQADLTDGFADLQLFDATIDALVGAVPQSDGGGTVVGEIVRQSWGYRLNAGADLGSADVLSVGALTGDLTLRAGVRARTGTADIDVAASGDVRLRDGAGLYSAGWDRGLSPQLEQVMAPITGSQGFTAYELIGTFLNGGQFAVGGGRVSVAAGGNLAADKAPREVTAWLTRIGSGAITEVPLYSDSEGFGAVPAHWGVAFGQFRNGVAAFGGGDLRVDVGGDIVNTLLAVPTAGRSLDGVVADTSGGLLVFQPSARTTEILGGGRLDLNAGGTLSGGQVLIGRGTGVLRTRGGAVASTAPQLYVGADAGVDWLAGNGLVLGGLLDPTVVALSQTQLTLLRDIGNASTTADIDNRFYTYTDGSRVRVGSLGGNVVFDGKGFGGFLPPSLTSVAFGGDVNVVATPLDFFPGSTGTLELLAAGNVTGNFTGSVQARLRQSDQDRSLLPSVDRPDIVTAVNRPAAVPVHTGDKVANVIVARDGSVQSSPGKRGFWTLEFAKQVVIQAGQDISGLAVRVQHVATDALSSFQAGRDIRQGDLRDNTGQFASNDRRIFEIAGPGSAEFVAFRNISLGTSSGIESIGNTRNAALDAEGASLRLLAGTGAEPAYDRFIEVYLSQDTSAYRDDINAVLAEVDAGRAGFASSSDETDLTIRPGEYGDELLAFLEDRGIPVTDGDALATFRTLDRAVQRILINDIVFAELKTWGSAAETADRADRLNYTRGYTALDTLFALDDSLGERAGDFAPGEVQQAVRQFLSIGDPQAANQAQVQLFGSLFPPREPKGDISLLLSQVQTLAGGDLAMLAPGGDINAGAADAAIIRKGPQDLGIVTARGGDIDIAVDRDLLVNSTRVFALQGDLLAWSSNGNIDAGKGAKTVTSVPDPITRIDPATGNTIIEFPPAVSGSGLQGENAALFAPRGAVNAGDAGIRTSGDLTIGAVEIVGTDNIDVGGVEIGFSTTDVVAVAPPNAASASSAATKGMESQGSMLGDEDELGERRILGTEVQFISVEVLSFGDGDCERGDENCGR